MTIIKNFTPHRIVVCEDGEIPVVIESTGLIRLKATTVADEPIDGIPTSRTVFGEPEGLPNYQEGTYYIVSQLVKSALPQRTDLLVPAEVVRDAEGNIIGCKSLGR